METISDRIRYARETVLDMTQEQLANAVGVRRQSVTNWERGGPISRTNAGKICALSSSLSLDWLLHGQGLQPGGRATDLPQNSQGHPDIDRIFQFVAGSYEALHLAPAEAVKLAAFVQELATSPLPQSAADEPHLTAKILAAVEVQKFLKSRRSQ